MFTPLLSLQNQGILLFMANSLFQGIALVFFFLLYFAESVVRNTIVSGFIENPTATKERSNQGIFPTGIMKRKLNLGFFTTTQINHGLKQ